MNTMPEQYIFSKSLEFYCAIALKREVNVVGTFPCLINFACVRGAMSHSLKCVVLVKNYDFI